MNVVINGIEFQNVDFTDVSTAAAYEAGLADFQNITGKQHENMSALIRDVCDIVADWVDAVLGEGSSDRLFDGKQSLTLATDIMRDMIAASSDAFDAYKQKTEQLTADIIAKRQKSGNRQQRREENRNLGKKNRSGNTADRYDYNRVAR